MNVEPAFGPMDKVLAAHGIGRTVAKELATKGLIEVFSIGTRLYVTTESVKQLPGKLAAQIVKRDRRAAG